MEGDLGIDLVIGRTMDILRRNFVAFGQLALPLVLAPKIATLFTLDSRFGFGSLSGLTSSFGLLGVAGVLMGLLFSATLIRASLNQAVGDDADVPDALAFSLRWFLPLIGVTLLQWLAIGFGLIVLIVPGVMFFCMFAIAAPALLAERSGVLAALGRSQTLTQGHRWKIFGIFLLFWIVTAIAGGLAGSLFAIFLPRAGGPLFEGVQMFQAVIQTISEMVEAPLVAALYIELRILKEGGMHESLSRIFE
jgi:hypothetical protein